MSNAVASTVTLPPQPLDSPNNHGPLLNVLTWFLVIVSFLTVSTRIATKWLVSKRFNVDDAIISASLVLSIGQVIAVGIAVLNGVGKHIDTLSSQEIETFQKAIYAANILWLLCQAFSKISVTIFIRVISPASYNANATLVLLVLISIWTFSSLVVLIFQCQIPQVWNTVNNKCINRDAFWVYSNSVNIIIDVFLIGLPWAVVWNLQLSFQRKVVVVGCFATRVLTIGSVVFQTVVLSSTKNTNDASYDQWLLQIAMALAQTLTIVTACVPYLKPFMDGLESGMIRSDDLLRRTEAPRKGSSYADARDRKSPLNSAVSKTLSKISKPMRPAEPTPHELARIEKTTVNTISAGITPNDDRDWDVGSVSSQTKIIKQTKSWGVVSSNAIDEDSPFHAI